MGGGAGELRLVMLGAVRGWLGGHELDLGSARQRATLAALLAAAGAPVGITELIGVQWPANPPASAVNILQRHIGALRRALQPELAARERGSLILAAGGGYRLAVDTAQSDVLDFRDRSAAAMAALGTDPAEATRLFTAALALREGPIAAGIPEEARAHPMFIALEREHLTVLRHAADAALRADAAETVAAVVQDAATAHPLDESLQARLIRVLAATGRQTDAFEVYRQVRERLADELGVDPGAELRAAHAAILRTEPTPEPATPVAALKPAQLPPDLAVFSGRHPELAALTDNLPPITTIGGTAGVGKTTLAVHLAHRLAERFPDGQLYADLHGFDAAPDALAPTEALRGFIDAIGSTPARDLPTGLDAQAALYRSGLAGKRVLVLLDNARDAEQAAPLLPASPGCAAIITSREPLSGLVARHGARVVNLGLPGFDEARDLLIARLGAQRVRAESDAADRIIDLCSRLPLALATVAARIAVDPGLTLTAVADDLTRHRGDLSPFTGPNAPMDVRSALSWSYRRLSPPAARLFRMLALHPCSTGGGIGLASVAAVAGAPPEEIREPLAEICRAQLLLRPAPGRYSFHDLLRAYATELVVADEPQDVREQTVTRILDSACASLRTANGLLDGKEPIPYDLPGTDYDTIGDRDAALTWFDTERLSLMACIKLAETTGHDRHVWWIARLLAPYLERWGHWLEWRSVQEMALAAARRIGEPLLEAAAGTTLGLALDALGHPEQAEKHHVAAIEAAKLSGHTYMRSAAQRALAAHHLRLDQYAEAQVLIEDAMVGYVELGHEVMRGLALNEIGWCRAHLDDLPGGLAAAQEALEILEKAGGTRSLAATWDTVGYIRARLGHTDLAVAAYTTAIGLRRDLGDQHPMATTLIRLARLLRDTGATSRAREAFGEAIDVLDALDHRDTEGIREELAAMGS